MQRACDGSPALDAPRRERQMKEFLRLVRGALGMGVTWAVGWAPLGAVLGWVVWILLDPLVGLGAIVASNAAGFGLLGFMGGALFSGVLRLAEGRRSFDQLSLPRFTAWGAVGGLLLGGIAVVGSFWGAGATPLLSGVFLGVSAVLGAGSAAGTLALARQAEGRDLLEAGAEVADAGLTEAEVERLTGRTRGRP